MIITLVLALLAALVLAAAGWTIVVQDAYTATLSFIFYGFLLALVWVSLASIDIALTEAAIGGGVTGFLLLGACARLPGAGSQTLKQPGRTQSALAAILCAAVSIGLAAIVLLLPEPAPTLATAAASNLAATGLGNPVTGVLLAFRALDTFLEAVILPLALVGVWSLAPDKAWGGRPGLQQSIDREGILRFFAQLLASLGAMMGIYIVWVGADKPGGAFQGGTILAAMWILAIVAGITDIPPISRRMIRLVLVAGPAVFLSIGLAGFAAPGAFMAYPTIIAKPLILIIEAALTLSIAATLGLLVAGPPERASKG